MQLFINNEKIDIQLETELYLADILESLEKQIQQAGGIISAILVNNESIHFSDDTWKHIPVHTINTLHIEADSPELTRTKLIDTFLHYLYSIHSFASQKELSLEQKQQGQHFLENKTLIQELKQIVSHIDNIVFGNKIQNTLSISLQKAFSLFGLLQEPPQLQYNEQAYVLLEQSIHTIEKHKQYSVSLEKQWNETTHTILQEIEIMKNFSSIIHSNDTNTISNTIISHIESIQQWLSVIQHAPKHCKDIQTYNTLYTDKTQQLNSIFKELEPAIKHNDWVTVADLIEYEIAVLLEAYAKQLIHDYSNEN